MENAAVVGAEEVRRHLAAAAAVVASDTDAGVSAAEAYDTEAADIGVAATVMGILQLCVQHLNRQSKLQLLSDTLQSVTSDSVGKWGASAAPPVAAADPGRNLSGEEIYQAAPQMLLPRHQSSVSVAGDPADGLVL